MATAEAFLYVISADQVDVFESPDLEVYGDAAGEDCLRSAAWLVRDGFINQPKSWGLALFRTHAQMDHWVSRAQDIYLAADGIFDNARAVFRFPSGARIQCDSLDRGGIFEAEADRYRGCGFARVVVFDPGNELSPRGRENIRNLCRSYGTDLRPQILYAHGR